METVRNSRDAVRILYPAMSKLDHEEAWVIFLTSCNGVIAAEMLSKGTLTSTAIDSRTILRQALLHNAASIILCHNHPSGNERPSTATSSSRWTTAVRRTTARNTRRLFTASAARPRWPTRWRA
ncbi:MAG: JAB domain-containing protein [Bacteroidales bacterium]|nr:JAB domain-containing protein [Bacteroidales bacterium]